MRRLVDPVGRRLVRLGAMLRSGSRESGEQMATLVDEASDVEALDEETHELVQNVFGFGGTIVREVMVPRTDMVTVDADAPVAEAIDLFLDHGMSRLPVIGEDADEVVGILHLRHAMRAVRDGDGEATASAICRAPSFAPDSQKADELLRQMQRERFHMAIVVDEYGGVAGLVTMEDIIEELVGEIADESDRGGDVVDLGDGRLRVQARMNLGDLGELFGIDLEDDDVDSVGGLLQKALGDVPTLASTVVVDGLRLTVDRMARRRVLTVVAQRAAGLEAAEDAFPPVKPRRARR